MTSQEKPITTEVVTLKSDDLHIELQNGQTFSEYLRDTSEKGKSAYIKTRAEKVILECLPAAKKGELSHTTYVTECIQADVIEYLKSQGVTVKDDSSILSKTYTYILSWKKPEEKLEEKPDEKPDEKPEEVDKTVTEVDN